MRLPNHHYSSRAVPLTARGGRAKGKYESFRDEIQSGNVVTTLFLNLVRRTVGVTWPRILFEICQLAEYAAIGNEQQTNRNEHGAGNGEQQQVFQI